MRFLLPLVVLIASATFAPAQQVRTEMLATTEWLAANLNNPGVVVLQVSRERATYDAGHIPGARFVSFNDLVIVRDGINNELPPLAQLVKVFEAAGVSDTSRIIIYDDNSGLSAARTWVTLDYLGRADRAALLNGGIEKWKAENRPVSTTPPQVSPGRLTPHVRPEVIVHLNAVRDISRAGVNGQASAPLLLDARPPAEYSGAKPAGNPPAIGHIPGAVNLYWNDNMAGKGDLSLRAVEDLRKNFEAAGATPDRKIVTYCNSGVQASMLYFMARYLGYDVALYDGSVGEWVKSSALPLTTLRPE